MAGPVKQFDQKQALAKALQVFWEKGFEATSMQDLVNAMGINRASMYDTFGNKQNLFNRALFEYSERTIENIRRVLEQPGSPLMNIVNYFKMMGSSTEMANNYGCFLNNTAVEFGPHDPQIANTIREQWNKVELMFKSALDKAIEQGELKADTDTLALARFFNTLTSGLAVRSKVNVSAEQISGVVKTAISLVRAAQK